MDTQQDLGSSGKNGRATEVLIAIVHLWFPSGLGVGCHEVSIPWSNRVSFPPRPPTSITAQFRSGAGNMVIVGIFT